MSKPSQAIGSESDTWKITQISNLGEDYEAEPKHWIKDEKEAPKQYLQGDYAPPK